MSVTVASIVKNEAGRFLAKAVDVWTQFADRVVVLDDGSTDETPDICREAGCEVHTESVGMWGNEWTARRRLFELATDGSEYVLWLDGDQIPASDPRPHLKGPVFGFRVFDLWSPTEYRDDPWWGGHRRPWWRGIDARCFTRNAWTWNERGVHCGHLPQNLPAETHEMPIECSVLHYGYATPELRRQKYEQYMRIVDQLTGQERFHAHTIVSEYPITKPLPFTPEWSLL